MSISCAVLKKRTKPLHFVCYLGSRRDANTKRKKKKNSPGDPDKVERVRDEVARVKDIMVTNIEALLERGERLDLLVDKTEQLSSNAVSFKQVRILIFASQNELLAY